MRDNFQHILIFSVYQNINKQVSISCVEEENHECIVGYHMVPSPLVHWMANRILLCLLVSSLFSYLIHLQRNFYNF